MVDILYNVMTRPVANEPSQKDAYHVDRAQKDAKAKEIQEEEPKKNPQQNAKQEKQKEQTEKELDERLNEKKKGKGVYEDEEGKTHLDIYA